MALKNINRCPHRIYVFLSITFSSRSGIGYKTIIFSKTSFFSTSWCLKYLAIICISFFVNIKLNDHIFSSSIHISQKNLFVVLDHINTTSYFPKLILSLVNCLSTSCSFCNLINSENIFTASLSHHIVKYDHLNIISHFPSLFFLIFIVIKSDLYK